MASGPSLGDLLSAVLGIDSAKQCTHGSASDCAWTALSVLPVGRLGKLAHAARDAEDVGRGAALIDTDVLVNAMKGDQSALAAIRSGVSLVTPNQFREFLAGGAGRSDFLDREGIKLLGGQDAADLAATPEFQETFKAALQHGRGDAALAAFARATGFTALTMDRRLANFLTLTLRGLDVPIAVVVPS